MNFPIVAESITVLFICEILYMYTLSTLEIWPMQRWWYTN